MSPKDENRESDGLISVLRRVVASETGQNVVHVVLYTTFGVVRGRMGMTLAKELGETNQRVDTTYEAVELSQTTVEHYSNHLPTAQFERLHVRLDDIRGFAVELIAVAQG